MLNTDSNDLYFTLRCQSCAVLNPDRGQAAGSRQQQRHRTGRLVSHFDSVFDRSWRVPTVKLAIVYARSVRGVT
jgi:hypothetical protein